MQWSEISEKGEENPDLCLSVWEAPLCRWAGWGEPESTGAGREASEWPGDTWLELGVWIHLKAKDEGGVGDRRCSLKSLLNMVP